jgi:hypothetical protein
MKIAYSFQMKAKPNEFVTTFHLFATNIPTIVTSYRRFRVTVYQKRWRCIMRKKEENVVLGRNDHPEQRESFTLD